MRGYKVLYQNFGITYFEAKDMDPLEAEMLLAVAGGMEAGNEMRLDYLKAEHAAKVKAKIKR